MRIAFCYVLAVLCLMTVANQVLYLATATPVERSLFLWHLLNTMVLMGIAAMLLSRAEKLRWQQQRRRLMASPRTKK